MLAGTGAEHAPYLTGIHRTFTGLDGALVVEPIAPEDFHARPEEEPPMRSLHTAAAMMALAGVGFTSVTFDEMEPSVHSDPKRDRPRPDRAERVARLREEVEAGQPHKNLRANARRLRQMQRAKA